MADEYISRPEFTELDHRLSKEIKTNREGIEQHSRELARLDAVYNSLEGLPVAIMNLEKTMVVISNSIETMGNNLNEVKNSVHEQEQNIKEIKKENMKQNEEIESIDNKSKVDIMLLIRDNFWKILSLLAVGYAVVEIIMKKAGG